MCLYLVKKQEKRKKEIKDIHCFFQHKRSISDFWKRKIKKKCKRAKKISLQVCRMVKKQIQSLVTWTSKGK